MGRRERDISPDCHLSSEVPSSSETGGFFREQPRRVYEYAGNENENIQTKRYRENLRLIQAEYIASGKHVGKQELTPREREVLQLSALSYSKAEISRDLNISEFTAARHLANISLRYKTETQLERILTGTVLGDIDVIKGIDPITMRYLSTQHFSPREWELMPGFICVTQRMTATTHHALHSHPLGSVTF